MTLTQKKWLKWAVIGFILGTIAVLAYRYFQPKKAAPTYITATAEQADIENSVMATGKVEALNQVDVGAQVSGEVTKLYVEVGQTVKKGDILAVLESPDLSDALKREQSSVQQLEAEVARQQILAKIEHHGQQGSQVNGHIEGDALIRPAQQLRG